MTPDTDHSLVKPLENAQIEWQDSGEPWSPVYNDVYFSRAGGMAETQHVFLSGNALLERWQALAAIPHSTCFTVAELGFGTGLNFLCTWQLWRQQPASQRHRLHFISCEKHPLRHEDLQRALQQWPELQTLATALLAVYPDHSPGYHRLLLSLPDEHCAPVTLDLYYGEACEMLDAQSNAALQVDAWYLDGFTPSRNPALWQDNLLQAISRLSAAGSTLASYSVTGRVLRTLRSLGWEVERQQGFGHKRHMLCAHQPGNSSAAISQSTRPRQVIVIGAGLAGCTTAWSLARRGYAVTVIEQEEHAAAGASGNPQAVLQCRLNRRADTQWQFNLQAFLFASRHYDWLSRQGLDFEWHRCGVLTLEAAYQNTRTHASAADYEHYPDAILYGVDPAAATACSGLPLDEPGLFMPAGGWLNPGSLCRALLQHPNINLLAGCEVGQLMPVTGDWQVSDANQQAIATAPYLILCNSYAARRLEQCSALPLMPLRGQISLMPQDSLSAAQRSVICGKSYLAPSQQGRHCIGASYVKHSENTELSQQESEAVVDALLESVPALAPTATRAEPGRAAIRGQSGDFMPMAGPLPHPAAWEGLFGGAQHHSEHSPQLHPDELPGVYINVGHGSHGMASCPLLAEHIAALISGEASPLSRAQTALLHPWRFVLRQRRRQQGSTSRSQVGSGAR